MIQTQIAFTIILLSLFTENMKMTNQRDWNFKVLLCKTRHVLIQLFSNSLTEDLSCLYSKRTKTYVTNENVSSDLYLNRNLTSYNFSISMSLKYERSRRKIENWPPFENIYSIHGKVYCKVVLECSQSI